MCVCVCVTGKHKMFDITVAATFSTHAKIKYALHRIVAYRSAFLRPNVCEKKFTSFLSSTEKMHTKENWFLFSLIVYIVYIC